MTAVALDDGSTDGQPHPHAVSLVVKKARTAFRMGNNIRCQQFVEEFGHAAGSL
jgi:hypothetical protein